MAVIVNSLYMAAQSKAAIASFLGRADWWHQALHALDESLVSENSIYIDAHDANLSELTLDDVIINFDSYGDLFIVDADNSLVHKKINCEVIF
ncbi:hypothetical protein [Klebsiella aerogenes]|uniref:hypothetical protein n=1 Tax=Klebsiella aerogenes TaxID=548 RepID=UPI0034D16FE9